MSQLEAVKPSKMDVKNNLDEQNHKYGGAQENGGKTHSKEDLFATKNSLKLSLKTKMVHMSSQSEFIVQY